MKARVQELASQIGELRVESEADLADQQLLAARHAAALQQQLERQRTQQYVYFFHNLCVGESVITSPRSFERWLRCVCESRGVPRRPAAAHRTARSRAAHCFLFLWLFFSSVHIFLLLTRIFIDREQELARQLQSVQYEHALQTQEGELQLRKYQEAQGIKSHQASSVIILHDYYILPRMVT